MSLHHSEQRQELYRKYLNTGNTSSKLIYFCVKIVIISSHNKNNICTDTIHNNRLFSVMQNLNRSQTKDLERKNSLLYQKRIYVIKAMFVQIYLSYYFNIPKYSSVNIPFKNYR